jgi:hypothetical protein
MYIATQFHRFAIHIAARAGVSAQINLCVVLDEVGRMTNLFKKKRPSDRRLLATLVPTFADRGMSCGQRERSLQP